MSAPPPPPAPQPTTRFERPERTSPRDGRKPDPSRSPEVSAPPSSSATPRQPCRLTATGAGDAEDAKAAKNAQGDAASSHNQISSALAKKAGKGGAERKKDGKYEEEEVKKEEKTSEKPAPARRSLIPAVPAKDVGERDHTYTCSTWVDVKSEAAAQRRREAAVREERVRRESQWQAQEAKVRVGTAPRPSTVRRDMTMRHRPNLFALLVMPACGYPARGSSKRRWQPCCVAVSKRSSTERQRVFATS